MLLPGDKRYPRGYKRAKARLRYWKMEDKDTPAARAAHGRVLYHDGNAPSKDLTLESVAWHREAGNAGYMNRAQRKHLP